MPVASTLSVQMLFSDGSVRDFSSDSRVLIVLAAVRSACQPLVQCTLAVDLACSASLLPIACMCITLAL